MILSLHTRLRDHISSVLNNLYDLDAGSMPAIVIEYPPNRQLGDIALTVAF